jgi:hypothetical protein
VIPSGERIGPDCIFAKPFRGGFVPEALPSETKSMQPYMYFEDLRSKHSFPNKRNHVPEMHLCLRVCLANRTGAVYGLLFLWLDLYVDCLNLYVGAGLVWVSGIAS